MPVDERDQPFFGHPPIHHRPHPPALDPARHHAPRRAQNSPHIILRVAVRNAAREAQHLRARFHRRVRSPHVARDRLDASAPKLQQQPLILRLRPPPPPLRVEPEPSRAILERMPRPPGLGHQRAHRGRALAFTQRPGQPQPPVQLLRPEVDPRRHQPCSSSRSASCPSHSRTCRFPLITRSRRSIWITCPSSGAFAAARSASDSIRK